jgi:hypothetical protein
MRYQICKLPMGEPTTSVGVYGDKWIALCELLKIAGYLSDNAWLWSVQCETSQGPWPMCTVSDLSGTVWTLKEVASEV